MFQNTLMYYNYNYINCRDGSRVYCDTFTPPSLHINEIHSYLNSYVQTICHYNKCYSHDTHQTLFIYYLYIKCIIHIKAS